MLVALKAILCWMALVSVVAGFVLGCAYVTQLISQKREDKEHG